jgi:uncharacterized protein (TIGR02611 family)
MTSTQTTPRGLMARLKATRARIRSTRTGRLVLKSVVGVVGVAVIAVGIVLLPLPGPGWLIIFAGLGIMASEFEWANRLLNYARRQVSAWTRWASTQSRPVQALIGLAGLIVLAGALLLAWWIYTR